MSNIKYLTSEIGYEYDEDIEHAIHFYLRERASYKPYRSDESTGSGLEGPMKRILGIEESSTEETPAHIQSMLDMPDEVNGVECVVVYGYEVVIRKAKMYNWDELFPNIKNYIESMLDQKRMVENINT